MSIENPAMAEKNGDPNTNPYSITADDEEQIGNGHFFVKKTFHKPTYCHHCTDILWGLIGVGYVCEGKLLQASD